jgi:hypothetical protein
MMLLRSSKLTTLCSLTLFICIAYSTADVIDQFARQGRALVTESLIPGVNIRQCTCAEQTECVEQMKDQALSCVNECWSRFDEITNHPQDLRKCFKRADSLLEELVNCFEHNVDSYAFLASVLSGRESLNFTKKTLDVLKKKQT